MNLKIYKQQTDEGLMVRVAGEIDAFTAPKLREELLALANGKKKTIVVNMKDVSYLDSTGIGVFVGLFKQLKKNGGELQLVDLSERVKRLFQITGLSHILNISEMKG